MLTDDLIYLSCLKLASAGSGKIRFGALLFDKDGQLAGFDRSRQRRPSDAFKMAGPGIHAEPAAINGALLEGTDPSGGTIYVAGYFQKGANLYIPKEPMFSCVYCPPILERYGIAMLGVPVESRGRSGWEYLSVGDAKRLAERFRDKAMEERERIGRSERTVRELGLDSYSELPILAAGKR